MTVATGSDLDRPWNFVLRSTDNSYSRTEIVVASGAGVVKAGMVMGKITASGKWKPYNPAAADGTEIAAGIIGHEVDATSADVRAAALTYSVCVVSKARLRWGPGVTTQSHKNAAYTALSNTKTATDLKSIAFI